MINWKKLYQYPIPEIIILLIILITVSFPGLKGQILTWDDARFITFNDNIRSFEKIPYVFTHIMFEAYQPIHMISYMIDYALWGLWSPGYHIHNLVLFFFSLLLLNKLFLKFGVKRNFSFILMILFAIHPLHVESVIWISCRKDMLAFLFFMTATLFYFDMEKWRSRRGIFVIIFFILALLSKSQSLIFPLFTFGIDFFYKEIDWKQSLKKAVPLLSLTLIFSLIVLFLWKENELVRSNPQSMLSHFALVIQTYLFYIKKLFFPWPLSPLYPILKNPQFDILTLIILTLFIFVTYIVFIFKNRWLQFSWYWFIVSLLPVNNIVPVYYFAGDRYAFFTILSLVFLILYFIEVLNSKKINSMFIEAVVLILIVVSGFIFFNYSSKWKDNVTLWKYATTVMPGSYYAHLKYGEILRDSGKYDESSKQYQDAIRIEPQMRFAWFGLCWVESEKFGRNNKRDKQEWLSVTKELISRWENAPALDDIKGLMIKSGYLRCAEIAEYRSFEIEPPDEETLISSSAQWLQFGQPIIALKYMEKISPTKLNTKLTYHIIRGSAYAELKQKNKAIEEINRAEKINELVKNQNVTDMIEKIRQQLNL